MSEGRAWVRVSHRTKDLHPSRKRWEVVYADPGTKSRRTKGGFKTKGEAQEWAEEFTGSVRRGQWVDPEHGRVSFRKLAGEWFSAQHFERHHTANGYRRIITGNNDLMRTFGDAPVSSITHEAVSRFIKETAQTKAPQTVRHQFYVLRTVLDFAVYNKRLMVNPARTIDPRRLPKARRMHVYEEQRYPLTVAETERIIAALPQPYDVFTRLVAFTGMRPEEATGLTLADVDTDEGTVHVRAVVIEASGELVREEFTKTSKSRRLIDLDSTTLAHITAYIAEHRRRAAAWFTAHPEQVHPGEALPLFVGCGVGGRTTDSVLDRLDFSKSMRYSAFNKRYWRKALKTAGVPPIRFYDLRHADVSRHVDRIGQDGAFTLKEIQERYGHASAVMTLDRYAHAGKPDRAARRIALDAALATKDNNVTSITSHKLAGRPA